MKRGLLYLLALVTLASCAKDAAVDEPRVDGAEEKIYASIDDSEYSAYDGTRVELNDKKQTVWTAGDKILTFEYGKIYEWKFDGKTGDRNGSFSKTGQSYTDPYWESTIYDQYYAVYLSDLAVVQFVDKSPGFVTTLPATQHYKDHSYGLNTNAMLGTSSDGKNYQFINLMGYLRLSLTGNKVVKSITLESNNGETIAAKVYVYKNGMYLPNDLKSTSITLDCGDGVQLTDVPTEFYFTILPQTLSKGISVVVNFTDGTVFPKSTSKSITIERNHIQPMKNFNTGGEVEWQTVSILHTGSKIYAPYFYGSSALSGYIYWGDDYMSDVNSVSSYTYDDGMASHTITVKTMGTTAIEIDNCQGISEIDLTNF